jgi:hypothetical protein
MAKKKKGKRGRPAGSKNRKRSGGDIPTPLVSGSIIQSLIQQRKKLASEIKKLDQAIRVLRKLE